MQTRENDNLYKCHRRFGHINYADLQKMGKGIANGMNIQGEKKNINCEACLEGKQARIPFKHQIREVLPYLT